MAEETVPRSTATGAGHRRGRRYQRVTAPETRSRSGGGGAAGTTRSNNNEKKSATSKRRNRDIEPADYATSSEELSKKAKTTVSSRVQAINDNSNDNNNNGNSAGAVGVLQHRPQLNPQPPMPSAPMTRNNGGNRRIGSGAASVSSPDGMGAATNRPQAKPNAKAKRAGARKEDDPFGWLDDEVPVLPDPYYSGGTSTGQGATSIADQHQDSNSKPPLFAYKEPTATPPRPARMAATAAAATAASRARRHGESGTGAGREIGSGASAEAAAGAGEGGGAGAGAGEGVGVGTGAGAGAEEGAEEGAWTPQDDHRVEEAVRIEDNAKVAFHAACQVVHDKTSVQSSSQQAYNAAQARLLAVSKDRRAVQDMLKGPVKKWVETTLEGREECSREWVKTENNLKTAVDAAREADAEKREVDRSLREAEERLAAASAVRPSRFAGMDAGCKFFQTKESEVGRARVPAQLARIAARRASRRVDIEASERMHLSNDLQHAWVRHERAQARFREFQVCAETLCAEETKAQHAVCEAKFWRETATAAVDIATARCKVAQAVLDEAAFNVRLFRMPLPQRMLELYRKVPNRSWGAGAASGGDGNGGGNGNGNSDVTAGGRPRVKRKAAMAASAVWKAAGLTGQETKKRCRR